MTPCHEQGQGLILASLTCHITIDGEDEFLQPSTRRQSGEDGGNFKMKGRCLTSPEKLASDLTLPRMRQLARALPAARADPVPSSGSAVNSI